MMKLHVIAVCCLLLLMAAGGTASAAESNTLRCGKRLVSLGDNKAEVLIKCGEPAWKDAWTDQLITDVNTVNALRVSIDRECWVYNFGHHSFLRFLLFENGRLIKVTTGDYGYDDAKGDTFRRCKSSRLPRSGRERRYAA